MEPLDWATKAAVHAAYGLRLAGANRIRFPNFIRIELVWRLLRCFGNEGELARLAFLSFLRALRVPPEALLVRRSRKGVRWRFSLPDARRI